MKDYEVTNLFEVGRARETIEAKECCGLNEISGSFGPVETLEEE